MSEGEKRASLVQIALCTNDMVRSVEFLSVVFGFRDAQGVVVWGRDVAHIQGVGDYAACSIWWLVGRQDFLQFEVIQHSVPEQRPLPSDWRPSDIGWTRWGVAVPDLDACLERALAYSVRPITPPRDFGDGVRRACLRDPFVGCMIEVMEDGPAVPGGQRATRFDAEPAVVYATVSVPDLASARAFWTGAVGLEELPEGILHTPAMEELWGLAGAARDAAVLKAGDCLLELVQYRDPAPRPHPADYRVSDQGIMNVAMGFREREPFDALISRLEDIGVRPFTAILPPGAPAGGYIYTPDGTSVEILTMEERYHAAFGFVPRGASAMDTVLNDAASRSLPDTAGQAKIHSGEEP